MKERRLKAGHFFFDAETGMGAGEVPLVLFKLHVRCMLFSLDSQAIHLYLYMPILAQGTRGTDSNS